MKEIFFLIFVALILGACTEQLVSPDDKLALLKLETLPEVTHPTNNATSAIKIKLGKYLFYDPILSGERDISCVTCHQPKYGYADGLGLPIGVGGQGKSTDRIDQSNGRIPIVGRNAPTILNASYNGLLSYHQKYNPLTAPMFWDGRRKSLESQSLGPPTSFNEMRGSAYKEDLTYDS
jgi:cytochrome c peroxidase